jgi:DeoR family fructose operon transcriptional repressor
MSDGAAGRPPQALFQPERHQEIVALTAAQGRVEVIELSSRFNVTPETIRRDLSELQNRRLLRRVHGGAVAWGTAAFEPLLSRRNQQHDNEKRRIARLAIEELPEAGVVIIDSGSTLVRFAEAIPRVAKLQFVTNSLPTAQVLSDCGDAEVMVIGGTLRKNTMAMVDSQAVRAVQDLRVDVLFVSCDGVSVDGGLTTPYRHEAALKAAMIHSARRVVALIDHSKFGHDHFIRFADWPDIDVLITNTEVDGETVASIEATGTIVRRA